MTTEQPDLTPYAVPVGPRTNRNTDPDHPVNDLWEALAPHHGPERATELIRAYYDAVTSGPTPEEVLMVAVEMPVSAARALHAATTPSLTTCGHTSEGVGGRDGKTRSTYGPCTLPTGHTGYCTRDGWKWSR